MKYSLDGFDLSVFPGHVWSLPSKKLLEEIRKENLEMKLTAID